MEKTVTRLLTKYLSNVQKITGQIVQYTTKIAQDI